MKDLWPKQAPVQGLTGLWGGTQGALQAAAASGGATGPGVYPETNILHLEAQNWSTGSNTWTQSNNSNSNYTTTATNPGTMSKTGSGDTAMINWPNTGTQYFNTANITLPVGIQVICAWKEGDPFIIEQSDGSGTANSHPGFYFYGDDSFIYGCYRQNWSTSPTSQRRHIAGGGGSDWFPDSNNIAVGAFYMSANGDATDGNKSTTTAVYVNNSTVPYNLDGPFNSDSEVTENMYIGSRNGVSIFFHGGSLAEIWIAKSENITLSQFQTNVAAMVTKQGI